MATEPEQLTRVELDPDTNNLLALWGVLEHDQILSTTGGEIYAKVIAAALTTGIKIRQIEIVWQHEKSLNHQRQLSTRREIRLPSPSIKPP